MPAVKPSRAARSRRPRRRRLPRSLRRLSAWAVPALACAFVFGTVASTRLPLGAAVAQHARDVAIDATAALGFVVTDVEVEGRLTTDPATIMAALGAARGTPILAVNPERAQKKLESLPWVRSAAIERRLPDTLFIRLVERIPLAVWQHDGRQQLIGRDGTVIAVTDLRRFASLPTVVGDDAASHARALIDMLSSEPDLAARVTAAIWVGGRRWNLRMAHAIDVLLPEDDPAAAWRHLAQLERTTGLLKRDVQTIDMRLPDRLVIRTTAAAAPKETTSAKKPHPAGKNT